LNRICTNYKELKIAYPGIIIAGNKYPLLWLAKEYNSIMANLLHQGSPKNYLTTHGYPGRFLQKRYPSNDILLRDLTYEFITRFENYICTTPIKPNAPCTSNGTMKHLARLRKMVTWTLQEPIPALKPGKDYSPDACMLQTTI